MKLKLSLKNSARSALSLLVILLLICGCSSSTAPTFLQEDIADAIRDICKNEYSMDVVTKLIGQTIWIYLPVEDLFTKAQKQEKYFEKFQIENNKVEYQYGLFKLEYAIKPVPETEKTQEIEYDKKALEKINNVWKTIRRVIFSAEHSEEHEPKFICLITADVKNGFETQEIFYVLDMKKVSYEYISWGEYHHRAVNENNISPEIIQDKGGEHVNYRDITLQEFLTLQIQHRIKLKFEKPEVNKSVDIDKEILKVVAHTLKIYNFRDFTEVVATNGLTNNTITLNQGAIWARPTD